MIKIETKSYGTVEVQEQQKISLDQGLFGFEGLRDYVLLDAPQKPFLVLQSMEDKEVAFILIDPRFFRDDYDPSFSNQELEEIALTQDSEKLLLAVVTLPPPGEGPITANLQGPLVINRNNRLGKQFITREECWKTRHDILQELSAKRKATC